jgi:YggT family protein
MSDRQVSQTTTSQHEPGLDQRVLTFKVTYLIWLVLGLLEALIGMRILLKLMAANPENLFAKFIYNFSYLFVFPFMGLTITPTAAGIVLELSSFIAIFVYALVFWAMERITWLIFYRPREAVVAVTQQSTSEQHARL